MLAEVKVIEGGQIIKKEEMKQTQMAQPLKSANILVIDDNQEIRDIISEMLIPKGHKVSQAEDGVQGLKVFEDDKFDVVSIAKRDESKGEERGKRDKIGRPLCRFICRSNTIETVLKEEKKLPFSPALVRQGQLG